MARKLRLRKSTKSDKDSSSSVSPKTSSVSSTPKSEQSESPSARNIPDILYAEDGSIFFPCKYCCRAFASKPDLDKHVKVCSTGGRSTPSPFSKQASNKENDEVSNNNNEELPKTPKRKVKEDNNNKRKAGSSPRKVKKRRSNSPDVQTNVITTGSVSENIHNLNPEMKAVVLENIKLILKNSPISIISDDENPIIVQTAANEKQPALQITSRNINENCVEIKTVRTPGEKNGEKLPDIAEILERNFGNSKPYKPAKRAASSPVTKTAKRPLHAQSIIDDFEIEETPEIPVFKVPGVENGELEIGDGVKEIMDFQNMEDVEAEIKNIRSKYPKPIHEESLIGDSEIGDIILYDVELEGSIVLEDLDIHICKQCGSVYQSLEDLVNHDKYEHRNVKKRYPPSELAKFDKMFKVANSTTCPICSKVLSNKTAWPRHLQTHSVVLNYECRICKRKFTRNDHRKLHENRHVLNITDVDE